MRKLLSLFPLIAALVAVSAVATAQTGYESATEVEGATTVDAATAKQLFDRGVIFVDVRDAEGDEWSPGYEMGHIPGAVHLGWVGTFRESALSDILMKDQEVVFYCAGSSCFRASLACKKAVAWGFEKVYYFRDGYRMWKHTGYPVEE